jgi:hypothetical protein
MDEKGTLHRVPSGCFAFLVDHGSVGSPPHWKEDLSPGMR